MKNFIDLNILNPALAPFSREVGWERTSTLNIVQLSSPRKIKNQPGELTVIESPSPDVLAQMCKKFEGDFDLINPLPAEKFFNSNALIEMAVARKKTFEIPIYPFLHSSLTSRAKLIGQTHKFLHTCAKRGIPFIFTSRAQSEFDVKSPREIIAFAQSLGVKPQEAAAAISIVPAKLGETE